MTLVWRILSLLLCLLLTVPALPSTRPPSLPPPAIGTTSPVRKYLYAHNNPVNRIDPSGHESLLSLSATMGIMGFANRLELQGGNAALQRARVLFGADEGVNRLLYGMDVLAVIDEKVGWAALGGATVYGGFRLLAFLETVVERRVAARVADSLTRLMAARAGNTFESDCAAAAAALAQAFRGKTVGIVRETNLSTHWLQDVFGRQFQPLARDGATARNLLEKEMARRGAGANMIVHGRNKAGGKGHVWNAYNNGGTIQFFDISHDGQRIAAGEQWNKLQDFWYLPVE